MGFGVFFNFKPALNATKCPHQCGGQQGCPCSLEAAGVRLATLRKQILDRSGGPGPGLVVFMGFVSGGWERLGTLAHALWLCPVASSEELDQRQMGFQSGPGLGGHEAVGIGAPALRKDAGKGVGCLGQRTEWGLRALAGLGLHPLLWSTGWDDACSSGSQGAGALSTAHQQPCLSPVSTGAG